MNGFHSDWLKLKPCKLPLQINRAEIDQFPEAKFGGAEGFHPRCVGADRERPGHAPLRRRQALRGGPAEGPQCPQD